MKLDVREAARLLSVSETQLYRWVEDGEIPCYTVRHQPLFSRVELLEWATAKRLPISVELFAGSSARLVDAIGRGGVHPHVPGTDRDAVLRAVVDRLPVPTSADRALILSILRARESEASTGIGEGIAIPHVRAPLVFAGGAPAITVCYLDHEVAFDAIDGRPVHTIFAMLTPTVRVHLELLSRLSHALLDPGFLAVVKRRGSMEEILAEARRVEAALPDLANDDDASEDDGDDDDQDRRP
jgi:PTS system nitrogen regulatory IIA component